MLRGGGDLPMRLYEMLLSGAMATLVRPSPSATGGEPWHEVVRTGCVSRMGFNDDQALLPYATRHCECDAGTLIECGT